MTAPNPQHDPVILPHDYDGIQEFDNPLPFWWKGVFVLCIAHAAAYLYWYHGGGPGVSERAEYAADLKAYEAMLAAQPKPAQTMDEAALAALAQDGDAVARGNAVFQKNCASCHTENGRGLVGPNLTDGFQIHGATRLDIYQTIINGVVEKGMLAWGPVLPPDELAAAAAFVITLRGTEVPGGKAAEGAAVSAFPN